MENERKMERVWLVVGETGEYSDHCEWIVAGFGYAKLAYQFRDLCQREADKINELEPSVRSRMLAMGEFKHRLDPKFHCEYNGTSYSVKKVNVFSELDMCVEP